MMFKNPIMIIVCLATMFAISWQLTLFVLILLPTAGYIMGQVGKKLKRRSLEGQNQWGLLMSIIEETLGGLRIVKAFNAEDKMIKWFHDDNNRFYRISNRINRRQSLAHPMSEFLTLEQDISQYAKAQGFPYRINDLPYGRSEKGKPVIVNYFYHEKIRLTK